MNKKGFTLIELLATITILALVATLVTVNIPKIFKNQDEQIENNKKQIIEDAACVYIELEKNKNLKEECLTNSCEVKVQDLIKEKLLEEKDVNGDEVIKIVNINNEKICSLK